jgi:hypothetical protein
MTNTTSHQRPTSSTSPGEEIDDNRRYDWGTERQSDKAALEGFQYVDLVLKFVVVLVSCDQRSIKRLLLGFMALVHTLVALGEESLDVSAVAYHREA